MKRKPIAICAVPWNSEAAQKLINHVTPLVALCDDGTIWALKTGQDGWAKLTDIPQPSTSDTMKIKLENKIEKYLDIDL